MLISRTQRVEERTDPSHWNTVPLPVTSIADDICGYLLQCLEFSFSFKLLFFFWGGVGVKSKVFDEENLIPRRDEDLSYIIAGDAARVRCFIALRGT